jgi:hypothetical protein
MSRTRYSALFFLVVSHFSFSDLVTFAFALSVAFFHAFVLFKNISRLILSHCASMSEDRFIQIAKGTTPTPCWVPLSTGHVTSC